MMMSNTEVVLSPRDKEASTSMDLLGACWDDVCSSMLGPEDSVCGNSRSRLQPFHHMAFLYGLMKRQRTYICAHSIAAIVIERVLPGSNVYKLLRIPLSMNLRCLSRITPDQISLSFPKQTVILFEITWDEKCFHLLTEPEEAGWLEDSVLAIGRQ